MIYKATQQKISVIYKWKQQIFIMKTSKNTAEHDFPNFGSMEWWEIKLKQNLS